MADKHKADQRDDRRKAALRENLKRRKAAFRSKEKTGQRKPVDEGQS